MMTPADKAAKAREILNSNPSEEDITIGVGLAQEAAAEGDPEGLGKFGAYVPSRRRCGERPGKGQ